MDCNCNNNYYVDENGERHTDIPMGTSPQAAYARTNLLLNNKVEQLENEMAGIQEALTQTVDHVNQSMESLSDSIHQDLDEMSENIEASVNVTLSEINARVDNIIAHNNDTEGNTELVDIRTGADGTVYTSAGAAVRSLGETIDFLSGNECAVLSFSDWIQGGISNSTGQRYDSTTRISSGTFHSFSRSIIYLQASDGCCVSCYEYNSNNQLLKAYGSYMMSFVKISVIPTRRYKFELYNSNGILPEDSDSLAITQTNVHTDDHISLSDSTEKISALACTDSFSLSVSKWEQGGINSTGIYASSNRVRSAEYIDMRRFAGTAMTISVEAPCVIAFATYQLNTDGTYTLVDNVNEDIGSYVTTIVKPLFYRFLIRNSNGLDVNQLPEYQITVAKTSNADIYSHFENYSFNSTTGEWFTSNNRIAVRSAMIYPCDVFVQIDNNMKISFQYWNNDDTLTPANFVEGTGWSDNEYHLIKSGHYFTFVIARKDSSPIRQESVQPDILKISNALNSETIKLDRSIAALNRVMQGETIQMSSWAQGGLGDNGLIYSSSNRIYTDEYFRFEDFDGCILRLSTNGYGITYHSYTYSNGSYILNSHYSSTTATRCDIRIDKNLYYRFGLYLSTGMNYQTDGDKLNASFILPYMTEHDADTYKAYNELQSPWIIQCENINKIRNGNFTFAVQTDTHFDFDNSSGHNWSDISYANNLRLFASYCALDFIANLGDIAEGYPEDTADDTRKDITEAVRRYCYPHTCPVLLTIGNHDNGYIYANGDTNLILSPNELHDRIFKPMSQTGNMIFPSNKANYYYCDFDNIRVIMLNTCDVPTGTAPIGNEIYKISSDQVSWFNNVALDTNKDIIVMTHAGLIDEMTDTVPINADAILSALQNYNGNVIACIYGHLHSQNSIKKDGINHICCTWLGKRAEVFMVDTQNRIITTRMIGVYDNADSNRSFTY